MDLKQEILKLKEKLDVTIVAHYYQHDSVFELADIVGDSLELAKKSMETQTEFIVFCGVGFMGQSVKILAPEKRVLMPKIACCAMARMIESESFLEAVKYLNDAGIPNEKILPITYINSNASVKAEVGKMGGMVCTSSNAEKIITKALKENKKILFVPDRCLGENIAKKMGLKSTVVGRRDDPKDADIICFNGFCSVHQLFSVEDIEFFRNKYPGIKIISHPECTVEVCDESDFVGSTSQIIKYIDALDPEQKIAVATEFNLVNRLRDKNTYVLSATKPVCPTMNETGLQELYDVLKSIDDNDIQNEVLVDEETTKWAKIALERMFEI
ncbi:MAG: Quinolinate synthetase (EC [uncultured Campylobacterales bacterium]|uniref:Quinolinate synthase n=1 Tax=uncultured Campylobacterales bacterium TaxID=352960 RepID=A0A6S6T2L4_9BACT|nr:MAG: Quinolinate synthetase (EC [uncultured Campylobacterales bacterium]